MSIAIATHKSQALRASKAYRFGDLLALFPFSTFGECEEDMC